jgi:hypothetical protein
MLKRLLLILSLMKGGENNMVDVYVTLIVLKRRTIEQVPTHLQPAVLADLNAIGLDGNGDPLAE